MGLLATQDHSFLPLKLTSTTFVLHLLYYIAFRLSYVYVIVNLRRTFVFELWCEQKLLLRNLDMSQAIASFLHLSFVFVLKYPQASIGGWGAEGKYKIMRTFTKKHQLLVLKLCKCAVFK